MLDPRPAPRTACPTLLVFLAWSACRDAAPPPAAPPAASPATVTAPTEPLATDPAQDADGERRATAAGADLIGRSAPTFTLTTIDGQQIRLTGAGFGRGSMTSSGLVVTPAYHPGRSRPRGHRGR